MTGRILITGAGGYLGHRIARAMLEETDAALVLWARPAAVAGLAEYFGPYGKRVLVCGGDLTEAAPFRDVPAHEVHAIVHSAAVTRFGVERQTAHQINVQGTLKLLEFAAGCRAIESFAHLSSIYSSGLEHGALLESCGRTPSSFANEYERSKWNAEAAVISGHSRFRRQIFRVATVVCDDDSGQLTQENVVYQLLKLLYTGLLPILPGQPTTPIYLVTGELVARAVTALLGRSEDAAVFHVSPARASACTLQELLDWSHEAMSRHDAFRRRRVLKPLFADAPTFDFLARTARTFSADIGPVVELVQPFGKQLFACKEVDNARLRAAWPAYRLAPMRELVEKTCEWLVHSKWKTKERA